MSIVSGITTIEKTQKNSQQRNMSLLDLFKVNLQVLFNQENTSLTRLYVLTHDTRNYLFLTFYVSLTIQIIKPLLLRIIFFVLISYKTLST